MNTCGKTDPARSILVRPLPIQTGTAFRIAVSVLVVLAAGTRSRADDRSEGLQTEFSREVAPLLSRYCSACHGKDNREAGLNFSKLSSGMLSDNDVAVWSSVRDELKAHNMPPEDEAQPSSNERQRIIDWIDQSFDVGDHRRKRKRSEGGKSRVTTDGGRSMSRSHRHTRRRVMQLGLAGIALPPLASVAGDPISARAASAGKPPARLVTIFFPNGVSLPPEGHASFQDWHWFPHSPGTDYVLTRALEPLADHRKDLTIPSGLSHPSLRTNITHSCSAQFLTGVDQSNGYQNSISYDQVYADAIEGRTRFSSLALSTAGGTGSLGRPATLSVNRDGALIPAMSDPQQIFNRLFVVDSRSIKARSRSIARDRSILDQVSSRLPQLNGSLATEDRHYLDSYLIATRTLGRQLERANDWLTVLKPEVDSGLFDFDAKPTRDLGTNYMRTMFDLIHMALLTDSTRVVTYQMAMENAGGPGNKLPYAAGLSLHHHQLSHSAARDKDGWERWARYDQYLAKRLSAFLTKLATTPDPLAEGSMLDNTIVLYGCGTSKTHIGKTIHWFWPEEKISA